MLICLGDVMSFMARKDLLSTETKSGMIIGCAPWQFTSMEEGRVKVDSGKICFLE